ncbi:MAG: hypothetical protein AAGK01_07010 [Pseudomonadota bacterium]
MDENETELLRLLYTRIGMVMEDASILAIDLGAPSSQFDPDKVEALRKSVATITKLMDAVQSIAE